MSKSSLKLLSQALAERLTKGALPGELQGFGPAEQQEAAAFLTATAERRESGTAAIALESMPGDGGARRMRLAIVNDDMPFLVDSIAAAIGAHDIPIDRIIHPVMPVTRDADGVLTGVADGASTRESMIYIETERADARIRRDLVDDLTASLADVRAAVKDWRAMQATLAADAGEVEDTGGDAEGAALMRWFLDRHFTLLGQERWLETGGVHGQALGLARNAHEPPLLADRSRERIGRHRC
jgi:glutamate dehydrogenase